MRLRIPLFIASASLLALSAGAQVPVDDDGNPIGTVYSSDGSDDADYATNDDIRLSVTELGDLVAPVALYPDDLLAIVLPASTFPLQVVEAARFLEALEDDPELKPDDDWDDSIVALLNYPEVVALMNDDLDWTWALGEAVVAQQPDVLTAVNDFRNRARAAGNLQTDERQRIQENDEGIIEIEPFNDDVIYVPYYEPERVVVYQTQPVYHYYSRPYPVYYYPYPSHHVHYRPFWGVTTAFSIGWVSHSLHVWHHSHYGHPFYGHYYRDYWWYRRPSINVFHSRYYGHDRYVRRHYRYGDYWQPRYDRRLSRSNQRITRNYGSRTTANRPATRSRYGYGSNRSDSDRQRDRNTRSGTYRESPNRSVDRRRPSGTESGSTRRSNFASANRGDATARGDARQRPSVSTSQRRTESIRRQPERSTTQTRRPSTGSGSSQRRTESDRPRTSQRNAPIQRPSTSSRSSARRSEPSSWRASVVRQPKSSTIAPLGCRL